MSPALAKISATLGAVLTALQADHAAGGGGTAWALAERVERAAATANLIASAFNAGKVRGEAEALGRHRAELAELQARLTPGHQGADRRSWRDVAVGGGAGRGTDVGARKQGAGHAGGISGFSGFSGFPGTAERPPCRTSDPRRTLFLTPSDKAAVQRPIEAYAFGAALNAVLGASADAPILSDVGRTPAGLFRVEMPPSYTDKLLQRDRIVVPGFGEWSATRMHSSTGPSLVVMGVDPSMSDDAVVTGIIAGSRELLDERERAKLGSIRAKRLFLGAQGGKPDANSARGTQASWGTPPALPALCACMRIPRSSLVLRPWGMSSSGGPPSHAADISPGSFFVLSVVGWGTTPPTITGGVFVQLRGGGDAKWGASKTSRPRY